MSVSEPGEVPQGILFLARQQVILCSEGGPNEEEKMNSEIFAYSESHDGVSIGGGGLMASTLSRRRTRASSWSIVAPLRSLVQGSTPPLQPSKLETTVAQ